MFNSNTKTFRFTQSILFVVASIFALTLSSCTTTKLFPLCPKLGKTKPSSIPGVSKTMYDICQSRNIKITVLSSTTVELQASSKQMKWLQNNYFIILCDFDQHSVLIDEKVYSGCMNKAKEWIKIVQGKNPETLMLDGTTYCDVCCEDSN